MDQNTKAVKSKEELAALLDEPLPSSLGLQDISQRVLAEQTQNHKWASIVLSYDENFPRVYRVLMIVTDVIIILFVDALTFNLTNPDDGSCDDYRTRATCLEPVSDFNTGEEKCHWVDYECSFNAPEKSFKTLLFVMFFVAIISIPLVKTSEYIIEKVLAVPVAGVKEKPVEEPRIRSMSSPVPGSSESESRTATGNIETAGSSELGYHTRSNTGNNVKTAERRLSIASFDSGSSSSSSGYTYRTHSSESSAGELPQWRTTSQHKDNNRDTYSRGWSAMSGTGASVNTKVTVTDLRRRHFAAMESQHPKIPAEIYERILVLTEELKEYRHNLPIMERTKFDGKCFKMHSKHQTRI